MNVHQRRSGGLHWGVSAFVSLLVVLAFTVVVAIASAVVVRRGVAVLERYDPNVGVPQNADRARVTGRDR